MPNPNEKKKEELAQQPAPLMKKPPTPEPEEPTSKKEDEKAAKPATDDLLKKQKKKTPEDQNGKSGLDLYDYYQKVYDKAAKASNQALKAVSKKATQAVRAKMSTSKGTVAGAISIASGSSNAKKSKSGSIKIQAQKLLKGAVETVVAASITKLTKK